MSRASRNGRRLFGISNATVVDAGGIGVLPLAATLGVSGD
jgi:hypothetical protein